AERRGDYNGFDNPTLVVVTCARPRVGANDRKYGLRSVASSDYLIDHVKVADDSNAKAVSRSKSTRPKLVEVIQLCCVQKIRVDIPDVLKVIAVNVDLVDAR